MVDADVLSKLRSSRGNEAQIYLETIIGLEPPHGFFNGSLNLCGKFAAEIFQHHR